MTDNSESGWAICGREGIDIGIGVYRTRDAAIVVACIQFDRDSADEAWNRANLGNIFPSRKLSNTNRFAWRRLSREYGLRAVRVRVTRETDE